MVLAWTKEAGTDVIVSAEANGVRLIYLQKFRGRSGLSSVSASAVWSWGKRVCVAELLADSSSDQPVWAWVFAGPLGAWHAALGLECGALG